MSGNVKKKAYEAAWRVIPLQKQSAVRDPLRMKDFMAGYMAGHAAHTRWANKREFAKRLQNTSEHPHE